MNQEKIGKYILSRRKHKNLTQVQLAESLGITDRAVSKWERGKGLPDASIMLDLCNVLDITVNELLSGEDLNMEEYGKKAEENLCEMKRQKEESDKRLLNIEIVLGTLVSVQFVILVFVASYVQMLDWLRVLLIAVGFIPFVIGAGVCLVIEQKAGYYECAKCHHKFVPTFGQVLCAMHINRTRYLKCPSCNKKSWCKKRITKD